MHRVRPIVGVIAGAIMMLSSVAHSLLGWKVMRSGLEQSGVSGELVEALGTGWRLGGAAMLAFGVIVVVLFSQRLLGRTISLMPAVVVGTTYVVYGAWALATNHFDPFFLIFVIPGLMVLLAALPRRDR